VLSSPILNRGGADCAMALSRLMTPERYFRTVPLCHPIAAPRCTLVSPPDNHTDLEELGASAT
jgi:hypothetical protein